MIWRIEVKHKESVFDSLAEGIRKDIYDLGINKSLAVKVSLIYHLDAALDEAAVETVCRKLLSDSVTQEYSFSPYRPADVCSKPADKDEHIIEIAYNLGVMDPVEASTVKGIKDLGFPSVESVRTARKYTLRAALSKAQVAMITEKILSNKLIQHVVEHKQKKTASAGGDFMSAVELIMVDFLGADDKKLMDISREGQLFLNLDEMREIKKHFKKLRRNPTDCELETIAQTWSEHCYHKTFRGNIDYTYSQNGKKKTKRIKNLLKSTIVKATNEINKSWCVSVFHDNAGIIKFDKESHICFKVETHNHPSALEPYGGANTGIGGVIRDTLGTGLGARPVCNTDVFCFAPPEMSFDELPPGTLHPKRVMKGVVNGVRDYGNKMGIPTVNGAVLFDRRFVGNPLVYCGNIGIMPANKAFKKVHKGDLVVVVGGRTGRDGIHGATFSSGELTTESETISSGAVQIGDPIQEKKVLDTLMQARDMNLYSAVTDCGAGGLSSAVGEMGAQLGARVDLEKVPLKYSGLKYMEVWISESQERMVLSVPPKNKAALLKVFSDENVEASVIGEFTGTGRLELFFKNIQVCDLDMEFLHEGTPRITKKAVWSPAKLKDAKLPKSADLNAKLKEVLSHYNVCSKEWIIRQYDHEVQGGSAVKPLVGVNNDGPSDASVVAPKMESTKGFAVSNGINVRFGMIDPYWMAASCIDEAVRQIIAVGGELDKIAILDNFCWGNPDKPDRLGGLVRAAEGCYKTAVGYGVPFISGKDSLYNEYTEGKKSIAIPGTLLISAVGIVKDVRKSVTMDFKEAGNFVYAIGVTYDELGGSIYLDTLGELGSEVPKVDMKKAMKLFAALAKAIDKKLVRAAHDVSEGGLAVAIAEMAFSGGLGVEADARKIPYRGKARRDEAVLFSESNSRFLVEVDKRSRSGFEKLFKGLPLGLIGQVTESPRVCVKGLNGDICLDESLSELKNAWQSPLRW